LFTTDFGGPGDPRNLLRATRKAGCPVHDDHLVDRQFCAQAANEVWLTDITEHRTNECEL
jgi:transposase InsO family protein